MANEESGTTEEKASKKDVINPAFIGVTIHLQGNRSIVIHDTKDCIASIKKLGLQHLLM